MSYINCGVWVDGKRPPSKRALREALRQDAPEAVMFDQTALGPFLRVVEGRWFRTTLGTWFTADQIQDGDTLTVVGPDPYRNRKWYASVTRDPDTGRIVVR